MLKFVGWLLPVALALVASDASAACLVSPRKATLTKDYVVPIKSLTCGTGKKGGPQIRVEYARLSGAAAALFSNKGTSDMLKKAVGKVKVVENDALSTHMDLVARFGEVVEVPQNDELHASLTLNSTLEQDAIFGVMDRMDRELLRQIYTTTASYPAYYEISLLRKGILPTGMKYFFPIEEGSPGIINYWRYMNIGDVNSYSSRVKAYNKALYDLRISKVDIEFDQINQSLPSYLAMVEFMSADSLPAGFMVMTGTRIPGACGMGVVDLPGFDGWDFEYVGRDLGLDVVFIENTSKKAFRLDQVFGRRGQDTTLRESNGWPEPLAGAPSLGRLSLTLAPGERAVVPVRVALPPPPQIDAPDENREALEAAGYTLSELGVDSDSYAVPVMSDFIYGPELAVSGVSLDGTRIDFDEEPDMNLVDLSISSQAGSCPYLLSFDPDLGEWVNHGKVLHKAPGAALRYTDSKSFAGFRDRFRIEEREPEIAHLEGIALAVTLRDGRQLTLAPHSVGGQSRPTGAMRLLWGQSVEVAFAPPEGVRPSDIVASRLDVTGYYDRYSALMAGSALDTGRPDFSMGAIRSAIGVARPMGVPVAAQSIVPAPTTP